MISIIVTGFNKPEFVEIQYKLCKKFIKNNFQYFLYDNSKDSETSNKFTEICKKIGANYIKVPENNGCSSTRAGYSLDYAIKHNYENNKTPIMVLDSDLFPIKDINIDSFLQKADITGIGQARTSGGIEYEKTICATHKGPEEGLNLLGNNYIYYFNNQFLVLNLDNLNSFTKQNLFAPGRTNNFTGDCGCFLHNYFLQNNTKHYSVSIKYLKDIKKQNLLFEYFKKESEILPNGYSEVFNDCLLHFRSGSNWQNHSQTIIELREDNLFNFLNKLAIQ